MALGEEVGDGAGGIGLAEDAIAQQIRHDQLAGGGVLRFQRLVVAGGILRVGQVQRGHAADGFGDAVAGVVDDAVAQIIRGGVAVIVPKCIDEHLCSSPFVRPLLFHRGIIRQITRIVTK